MAVNGSLNIINSSKVNIYTNCAAAVNYDATITSKGDVTIESTDGRAAKNLTIDKAWIMFTVIIKGHTSDFRKQPRFYGLPAL